MQILLSLQKLFFKPLTNFPEITSLPTGHALNVRNEKLTIIISEILFFFFSLNQSQSTFLKTIDVNNLEPMGQRVLCQLFRIEDMQMNRHDGANNTWKNRQLVLETDCQSVLNMTVRLFIDLNHIEIILNFKNIH